MNRKDFFKKLGFGVLAVIIAPKVLAISPTEEDIPDELKQQIIDSMDSFDGWTIQIHKNNEFKPNDILISEKGYTFQYEGEDGDYQIWKTHSL